MNPETVAVIIIIWGTTLFYIFREARLSGVERRIENLTATMESLAERVKALERGERP